MSSKRSTLSLILVLLTAVLAGAHPSAAQTTVITNDTITLGVNQEGHLNVVVDPSKAAEDAGWLGLQLDATGHDGLRHLGPREGWGVSVPGTSVSGFVNHAFDDFAGWVTDFDPAKVITFPFATVGPDHATSVVRITDGFNPVLEITHQWIPIDPALFTPYLFQANVTIRNLTSAPVGSGPQGIRYRRVMDWDAEPTFASEYVTMGGLSPTPPPHVLFTSDDGFETSMPGLFEDLWHSNHRPAGFPVDVFLDTQLVFDADDPQPCGFTTDFDLCGRGNLPFVTDHGALFDFAFPALAPAGTCDESACDTRVFTIFYGAAPTRAHAMEALYGVGAEIYSLANCEGDFPFFATEDATAPSNGACDPVAGTPTTFIFGVNGLAGNAALGDIFGTTFIDNNGDGIYQVGIDTPLAGVSLAVVRTDPATPSLTRTLVSDSHGLFDFTVLPHGSYSITSATTAAGYELTTASPLSFTIGSPVPCADPATFCAFYEANFGYRTGSVAGTIYGDADASLGRTAADIAVGPVAVTLLGADAGGPVSRTTVTAGDGTYAFDHVLSGTYLVSVPTPLSGLVTSTPNPRGAMVAAGQQVSSVDVGYCVTTATSVVSSQNPSVFGEPVTFTATVTSPCGSAVSGGGVTFSEAGVDIVTIPLNASGQAATTNSDLASGSHLITATYASGALLQPSSGAVNQVVTAKPSFTTITSNHNPSSPTQAVTFTATVVDSHGLAISQGSVQFSDNATAIGGPVNLEADGTASVTTTRTLGSHPIAAQYSSGTPDITGSSASLTQTVGDTTTTSVASSLNPSIVGQSVTFTATVATGGGEAVSGGTVTFKEGSTTLAGPLALNGGGQASFSTSTLTAGSHTITAAYSGTGFLAASSGSVLQTVNNPAVAESCFTFDFREITYFKTNHVIMSSDATIRSHNGIGGGFSPAVWPYNPGGGTNKTVSRGTLFRIYGFAASQIGHAIPNADNPAITYMVQADPQIPHVNFIDLGGPAKVFICPSQLQTKLIEGTPVKSWNLPGTAPLADVSKNIPGVMLNHNVERIAVPARVRNELAALGTPLKNPNGTAATYGLVDYVGVQQWGHGNANFREHVDLQIQFVSDDPANRPLHYQVGFHTAKNRDFEGFTSCDYQDFNPGNDGIRMNDVWEGTNVANPNWGPACGGLEPSVNQRQRENYAVPKNAVQILTTVNTHDDTMRVFYGTIRPAGNSNY